MRTMLGIVGTVVVVACGGTTAIDAGPDPAGPGEPGDVASVRLFEPSSGVELTQHMPLVSGETMRVEVRLYAPNGRGITEVTGVLELDFSFMPSSLASSAPVPSEPLMRDVTSSASTGNDGKLTVLLRFLIDGSTKTFGLFDVLVH